MSKIMTDLGTTIGSEFKSQRVRIENLESGKAPLASPALTGTPTAPTPAAGTNTTQLATTAFVTAADNTLLSNHLAAADPHPQYTTAAELETRIAALVAAAPTTLDTLNELATALGDDPNFATTVTNALAGKAPLASPALTGTPTAPTATAGTSTTQLATTAFVTAADNTLMSNHTAAADPHTQYLTKTGAQNITLDGGTY